MATTSALSSTAGMRTSNQQSPKSIRHQLGGRVAATRNTVGTTLYGFAATGGNTYRNRPTSSAPVANSVVTNVAVDRVLRGLEHERDAPDGAEHAPAVAVAGTVGRIDADGSGGRREPAPFSHTVAATSAVTKSIGSRPSTYLTSVTKNGSCNMRRNGKTSQPSMSCGPKLRLSASWEPRRGATNHVFRYGKIGLRRSAHIVHIQGPAAIRPAEFETVVARQFADQRRATQ